MAESARHLDLKNKVADFFKKRGWDVATEAIGPNWRADCLVTKDGRQAAIEIELSRPSFAQIKKRSDVYRKSGITSIWLVRERKDFPERGDLPIFPILNNQDVVAVDWDSNINLDQFLDALEGGGLHFRQPILDKCQAGVLVLFCANCYNCQQNFSVWQGLEVFSCVCQKIILPTSELEDAVFKQELQKIYDPIYGPFGLPAFYKTRATSLRPRPYYAAHCPHCNYVQGNWFLQSMARNVFHYPRGEEFVFLPSSALQDSKVTRQRLAEQSDRHWCLDPV